MDVSTKVVKGTEAGVPTKGNNWKTISTEFLGFPPADHAPVMPYIMRSIWAFDRAALPVWIRRAYRTHENKLVVRIFNGMAFESYLPSQQGKEPLYLLRPSGPYRFNGPIYDDRTWEWYPRNVERRDIPGVYLAWDEVRLSELRAARFRIYGRMNGHEKTDRELNALYPSKEVAIQRISDEAKLRLQEEAGPFQSDFVGYTKAPFEGH